MGNLINDKVLKNLKLNYCLFKLSKDPVPFFVFWVKNTTSPMSICHGATWENKLVKAGKIYPNGNAEELEFNDENFPDCGYLATSATISSPVLEYEKSEIGLKSYAQILLEYAEFLDFHTSTTYTKSETIKNNYGSCTNILETTVRTAKPHTNDPMEPWGPTVKTGKERFVIVIFPNSIHPPFVRVYNVPNFDIVNIDDSHCQYNSYSLNINSSTLNRKIEELNQKCNNIPVTKFDSYYKNPLTIFGQENYKAENGKEFYSNEAIDLNVIFDNLIYGKIKVKFGENILTGIEEKCTIDYKENVDKIYNFINEIVGSDNCILKVQESKVSPDGKFNLLKLSDCKGTTAKLYAVDKFNAGGILYFCDSVEIRIYLLDVQNQTIISTAKIFINSNDTISIRYNDIKNLDFLSNYVIPGISDKIDLTKLPLDHLIWKVHQLIESSTKIYYRGTDTSFEFKDGKFEFLVPKVEMFGTFARGIFGELIKVNS